MKHLERQKFPQGLMDLVYEIYGVGFHVQQVQLSHATGWHLFHWQKRLRFLGKTSAHARHTLERTCAFQSNQDLSREGL